MRRRFRRHIQAWWRVLVEWVRREQYLEVVHDPGLYEEPIDTGEPRDSRLKQRNRKKLALGFLAAMDEIANDIRADTGGPRGCRRFMREFGEASVNLSPDMLALLSRYSDIDFMAAWDPIKEIATLDHLDTTFVNGATDEDKGWTLHRYRRAGLRYCRSKLPLYIPGARWVSQCVTGRRMGQFFISWLFFTLDEGKSWYTLRVRADGKTIIKPCIDTGDMEGDEFWRELNCLRGAMFARNVDRLAWKIVMQRGALRFNFHCNDSIAREMLSLRDAGSGRRDAALHWVTDHDRKISDNRKVRVRAHLRGAQAFAWDDWQCTLLPGLFDQEALPTHKIPEMDLTERSRILSQ